MKNLSFTIDNAELVDENPDSSFAILSLDFFASGKNRHDTWVSDETLERTAETIYNRPIVWVYDKRLDDIGSHDKDEVPCGFIPNGAEIKRKKLSDGRTMLSVLSFVWKKYSGRLLEFFKRDGDKPVSVEMSIFDTAEMEDGLLEIKDYCFEAVTILGNFVTPAVPDASSSVFRFSDIEKKEYAMAFSKEFSGKYDDVDFTIPQSSKDFAKKALDEYRENGGKANSVYLAMGRFLLKSEKASPERVRQIHKFFTNRGEKTDLTIGLHGGKETAKWAKEIVDKLDEIDAKKLSFFDNNQKNTGEVPDNSENLSKEESMAEDEIKKEEIEEEKKEPAAEEKTETQEDEKKEEKKEEEMAVEEKIEEKKEEKKFSLDSYLDISATLAFLKAETESNEEMAEEYKTKIGMAVDELGKGAEFADAGVVMSALYAYCGRMSEKYSAMCGRMSELEKFKSDIEEQQKGMAVDAKLKEMGARVVIPDEKMQEFKEDAKNFSLENLSVWENNCKAKSFDFAAREENKEKHLRIANAWTDVNFEKPKNDIWFGTKK